MQHDRWAEQILELADESVRAKGDMALIGSYKLRIDSRKWLLSKLRPELYGERLAVDGNTGGATIVFLPAKGSDRAQVIDGEAVEVHEVEDGSEE
jgi:hypothetical protein